MIKRSQVACEHAFISAPAAWASSWRLLTKELEKAENPLNNKRTLWSEGTTFCWWWTADHSPPSPWWETAQSAHRAQTLSCWKSPEGSLLPTPLLWRIVLLEKLPCFCGAFLKLLILLEAEPSGCGGFNWTKSSHCSLSCFPDLSSPQILTPWKKKSFILENS